MGRTVEVGREDAIAVDRDLPRERTFSQIRREDLEDRELRELSRFAAKSREDLVTRVRALDRVLLWDFYMIPHFYISADRLLYWDRFGRPEIVPTEGLAIDTWWYDKAKAARLEAARGGGG